MKIVIFAENRFADSMKVVYSRVWSDNDRLEEYQAEVRKLLGLEKRFIPQCWYINVDGKELTTSQFLELENVST